MKKIAIFGAGGFGREVKILIDDINKINLNYEFIGFYDDAFNEGELINGYPVLGGVDEINNNIEEICLVLAIGEPKTKMSILNKITNPKLSFPTIIHPSVIMSNDDVIIEEGSVICAGNILTCNIKIEKFTILNLSCTVGHDTVIGAFSSFMPAVNISGEVKIKESVYVGTGTKIINQLEIGENTIVGAGAVVSRSLPANCTAVGIPAKPIKFHTNE